MATNSIFTISGKTCSLVKRTTSTTAPADPTSPAANVVPTTAASSAATSSKATALPDLASASSASSNPTSSRVQVQPVPDSTSADGQSKATSQSSPSATVVNGPALGSQSPAIGPTTSTTPDQNQQGNRASSVSTGAVVGIVLALLIGVAVAGGAWFVIRRYRRRRDGDGSNEKLPGRAEDPSGGEDNVSLLESIAQQMHRMKAVIVARFARQSDDDEYDDQPSDSPFSNEAETDAAPSSSKASPPKGFRKARDSLATRKSIFTARLRGNNRPLTRGSLNERDWLSKLAELRGKLFITNPSPPTPTDVEDPRRTPRTPNPRGRTPTFAPIQYLPPLGQMNSTDPRRSRTRSMSSRSMSFSAIIGEAMSTTAPTTTEALNQRSQSPNPSTRPSHRRRSTESSGYSTKNSFVNRGPSFYPPVTGPLPSFDDIQLANPFQDRPPVPAIPAGADSWRRSDPLGRQSYPRKISDHRSQSSGGSGSVVILPSIDAATANYNDAGLYSQNDRSSERGKRGISRERSSQAIIGRASSSGLRTSVLNAADDTNYNRNTMGWKFPSRTPSGTGYMFGSGIGGGGGGAGGRWGQRDTQYTAKSDPFDLER